MIRRRTLQILAREPALSTLTLSSTALQFTKWMSCTGCLRTADDAPLDGKGRTSGGYRIFLPRHDRARRPRPRCGGRPSAWNASRVGTPGARCPWIPWFCRSWIPSATSGYVSLPYGRNGRNAGSTAGNLASGVCSSVGLCRSHPSGSVRTVFSPRLNRGRSSKHVPLFRVATEELSAARIRDAINSATINHEALKKTLWWERICLDAGWIRPEYQPWPACYRVGRHSRHPGCRRRPIGVVRRPWGHDRPVDGPFRAGLPPSPSRTTDSATD